MPLTRDETIAGLRKPHWHYPFNLVSKRFAFSYTKTPLPSGIFSRATEASAS